MSHVADLPPRELCISVLSVRWLTVKARASILVTFLLFSVAAPAAAQEIAARDLLHEAIPPPATEEAPPKYPKGCDKVAGVGFADGVSMPDGNIPRKIQLGLLSISDTTLVADHEVVATVKLLNGGSKPIEIPWSTDFQTTFVGQDPDNRSWEVGEFQASLRDPRSQSQYYDQLINTSPLLVGSSSAPGTMLNIKPGEWITAQIGFRVAVRQSKFERITEGPADLAIEWFQTRRTHTTKDCGVMLGYFPYDGFYDHANRAVVRRVEIKIPEQAPAPSENPTPRPTPSTPASVRLAIPSVTLRAPTT